MRLQEILKRLGEIRTLLASDQDVDIKALQEEVRKLTEEKEQIETRNQMIADLNANPDLGEQRSSFNPDNSVVGSKPGEPKIQTRSHVDIVKEKREMRGQALKVARGGEPTEVMIRSLDLESVEERAETVGNSTVLLPTAFARDIKDTFNQVSSLVDRVAVIPLMGGESYQRPLVTAYGEGAETAIDAASTDVETVFKLVDIGKSQITAYQEWPRQITKLANAPYEQFVSNGITIAMRKRLAKQILLGSGAANNLTGIFTNGAGMIALSAANDKEITAITNTTLQDIVFDYGGDEDMEQDAVLILNKKDLKAFASIRTDDGYPFYKIEYRGNTGFIGHMDGSIMVPYIINSNCKVTATALAGDYLMAYGALDNYELAVFSDVEIRRSEDSKFKERLIAYGGEGYFGGNVVKLNGFLRVKKGA